MKCTRPIHLYFSALGEKISKKQYEIAYLESQSKGTPAPFTKDVGCGKCLACRINKRREWTLRLCHEEVFSETAYFITLTYDEDHVPMSVDKETGSVCMAVKKEDIQLFMKRLRKACSDKQIRFFLNSEYGQQTQRPHYHALVFNIPEDKIFQDSRIIKRGRSTSFTSPWLASIWKNGNVEFGIASKERAGYCAKYFIDRKEIDEDHVPNFSLMSRCPGIGYAYMKQIREKVRVYGLTGCMNACGTYVKLPRYYDGKIYSDEERHERFLDHAYEVPDEDYFTMLDNADLVEAARRRALTWKGKKSKI